MTNAHLCARWATTLLLTFTIFSIGCSDSVEEGGAECPVGEIYNPVTGVCSPRTSGTTPEMDGGTGGNNGGTDGGGMGNNGGNDDAGMPQDMPSTCTGNERRCNGGNVEICSNGSFQLLEMCTGGFVCNLGNCVPDDMQLCTPGTTQCASRTSTETCASDGESYEPAVPCAEDEECQGGVCTKSCAGFIDKKSNIGCEYVTMRHDQRTGIQTLPHTVVVSNPNTDPVTISVSSPAGIQTNIPDQVVQPNDSAVLDFPTAPMVGAPGVSQNIYVITSSLPVIATQFSPLNNPGLGSETSDASLLLPTNAIGNEYVVLGWPATEPGGTWIDVVATEPNTTVTVESPIPLSGGGAGSVAQNSTQTFNLSANQVLHLEENRGLFGSGTRDASGVRITSDNPVAVYTGATVTNIPNEPVAPSNDPNCIATPSQGQEANATCVDNSSCCSGLCANDPRMGMRYCQDGLPYLDHIEQQLFPVDSWGTSYVTVPFPSRGSNDFTIYRVVAAENATNVTIDPPVDGVSSVALDRGEYAQFISTTPFEVSADQPVMLAQFMIGGTISTLEDGDPAYLLPPAVEQYRDAYVFLVPGNYRKNRVTFVKQAGTQITLDGSVVPQSDFTAVGGAGGWEYATVNSLGAGVHSATSTQPFGVVVHGVDEYISYAFAGGVTLPE